MSLFHLQARLELFLLSSVLALWVQKKVWLNPELKAADLVYFYFLLWIYWKFNYYKLYFWKANLFVWRRLFWLFSPNVCTTTTYVPSTWSGLGLGQKIRSVISNSEACFKLVQKHSLSKPTHLHVNQDYYELWR